MALFFAGYILQQQTVHSLQDAIRPRLPSPNANVIQASQQRLEQASRGSENVLSVKDGSAQATIAKKHDLVDVKWDRLAYLRIVKSHKELCSAVMVFADLARSKSPAQRVLLFPQHWALENSATETSAEEDPQLYTTRRLLKKAARRYRAVLVPMGTMQSSMDENLEKSYSMTPAFSLRSHDRIILLPSAGVMLGSMPMDSFLAFSDPSEGVSSIVEGSDLLASPLMIQPAKVDYTALTRRIKSSPDPIADIDILRDSFPSIPVLPTFDDTSIVYTTTTSLQTHPANPGPATEFNATHFFQNTAFVRLEDEGLPGPEFDIPYAIRAEARPHNEQARRAWERVYEKFRAGRQDVCGLELEPWSPSQARGETGFGEL